MHHHLPFLVPVSREALQGRLPFTAPSDPAACCFPAASLPEVIAVTCFRLEVDRCKGQGSCRTHPSNPSVSREQSSVCLPRTA